MSYLKSPLLITFSRMDVWKNKEKSLKTPWKWTSIVLEESLKKVCHELWEPCYKAEISQNMMLNHNIKTKSTSFSLGIPSPVQTWSSPQGRPEVTWPWSVSAADRREWEVRPTYNEYQWFVYLHIPCACQQSDRGLLWRLERGNRGHNGRWVL